MQKSPRMKANLLMRAVCVKSFLAFVARVHPERASLFRSLRAGGVRVGIQTGRGHNRRFSVYFLTLAKAR